MAAIILARPPIMHTASDIVAKAVSTQGCENLPARVREIIDRHRQTLLDLANALLAAGRGEEEVAEVIQKASESFSLKLRAETENFPT